MDISAEIAAIQAASQGSELRQPLVGALNKLNSGSLPAVTASDAGKILKVGANGWEIGEKSGYMPVPTATKQITENGTHDVTDYAGAVVNVSGGGGSVLVAKTITENGTYDPADDNADGYDEVIVNVPAIQNIGDYIVGLYSNGRMIVSKQRVVTNMGDYNYRCIAFATTTLSNIDDFEIGCAFKIKDVTNSFTLFGEIGTVNFNRYPTFEITTNLELFFGYALASQSQNNVWSDVFYLTNLSLNTWYFARVKYKSSTKTLTAEITNDFINYTSVTKMLTDHIKIDSNQSFGYGAFSNATNRSKTALMDLYNTYIKVSDNIVFGAFTEQFPDFA